MKSEDKISLRDLQTWMRWIITDPRGVTTALENPNPIVTEHQNRYMQPIPSAKGLISTQPPMGLSDRLGIYAEAYFSRIVESMEGDFARVRLVLDELQFQKLVAEYLKAFPSRKFNIGEVGKDLARFLETYPGATEFPYLRELADFEWKIIETFYAPDTEPFDAQRLTNLSEDDWASLTVEISPSTKILSSIWPLEQFWNLADLPGVPSPFKQEEASSFLLWRDHGHVRFSAISAVEAYSLECFTNRKNLAETMDLVAGRFANQIDAASLSTQITDFFGRLLKDGLISNVNVELK